MIEALKRWLGLGPAKIVEEREIDGVRVRIDRAPVVVSLDAPVERRAIMSRSQGPATVEPPLLPRPPLRGAAQRMVSAALLAHKAKQVDDGLYAAVELAAGRGAGKLPGKAALLAGLVRGLAAPAGGRGKPAPAAATVLAAAVIGEPDAHRLPKALTAAVDSVLARFEGQPEASKPLGFYTWSEDLGRIFRRDRLLQEELRGAAGIAALAAVLRGDARLCEAYEAHLQLAARLTNPPPPGHPDLRALLADPGEGAPERGLWFFPPSRAHETDLMMRLYGDRPIPAGFSLADEMLEHVRAGTLDLAPRATSGWYDWQTWALETLAAPDCAPEARKLVLSPEYRTWLADLFRALLALTRETHVKQLQRVSPGAALPRREIKIRPDLRVEPVPTFYLRRALAYRFVRGVLEEAFGGKALSDMRRLGPDGPLGPGLADDLRDVETLFLGAYASSSADLGLPPDGDPAAAAAEPAFLAWRGKIENDPNLSGDTRVMVPLFHDVERRRTKVLAVLGWTERPVTATFATPPRVEVDDPDVAVSFGRQHDRLAYPVTAEVYVEKLRDRRQMRTLCDAKKTRQAIVAALEA